MPRVFDPMQQGAILPWSSGLFESVPYVQRPAVVSLEVLSGLEVTELDNFDEFQRLTGQPHQWQDTERGGL